MEAAELLTEVGQADGVVENAVGPEVVGVGAADDADDREILAEGPSDGVEDAEPANGERHRAGPDPTGPGIAIGSVPGVQLIAAAHEPQPGLGDQVVEEGEVEVPGDGEHVLHPDLDKAPSDVAAEDGLPHRGRGRGGGGALDGGDEAVGRRAADVVGGRLADVDRSDLRVHSSLYE